MAEAFGDSGRAITGRQAYFLEVPSARSAAGLSVVSFEALERLGEPYRVKVALTHPEELARADYLRKDATFVIDPGDGSEPRTFGGCITRFSRTGTTRDHSVYEMELRPKVALLTLTKASRVYQNKTAPQIIEAILRRHGLEGQQFAFRTRRQYPEHKFRLQFQMTDWDYIRLLMEQEGLYSFFVSGKFSAQFGDVFTVADDVDHYLYQPELRVPYRETAGLESGIETVFDLQTHVQTVPESFLTADYNPADAHERKSGEANIARKEKGTYGQSYVFGTHHLDAAGAKWEAQLRHEAALAGQLVYAGQSNVLSLRPARILRMDIDLPDAPNGQVITEVSHFGGRDQAYRNAYQAIPSDRRYRLPVDERQWPRIAGTLSARITSPSRYKYAYLTQDGHYVVRFDLDFDEWPHGGESVPLRLAKPFAGALQTGFHFPLIDGTEVAIGFHDGNPNRPYIAHALHNSQTSDLITSQRRWMSRNVIRTQANKLRFEDWEGQEGIKAATDYGKTQLNLGYLVDNKLGRRGGGYELRTDLKGVLRAGEGIFISADAQRGADGQALDMQAAKQQLDTAQARMKTLAEAVTRAKAVVAACEAQQALLEQQVAGLQEAVLLASAPRGMALTSGEHMQLAAGGHLFTTAGGNADTAVGGNYTVAAGNAVSLYANAQGMKLFAGKGKVELQAQADGLELTALKGVAIASTEDGITLNARKSLTLLCGGAYIKLEGGQVEIGSAGAIMLKGPLRIDGSATRQGALPLLPTQQESGMELWHTYPNGQPVKNAPFLVTFADGSTRQGRLDGNGKATLAQVPRGGGQVQYFEEDSRIQDPERKFAEAKGDAQTAKASSSGESSALPSMTGPVLCATPAFAQAAMTGGGAAAVEHLAVNVATNLATKAAGGSVASLVGKPLAAASTASLASPTATFAALNKNLL
ncbi:type VI secretion system Vgr family protein [Cupriavidus numazuensis]|uniref:Type VI secretion system tip protein VgrG n=1 Tax=Cupriavidus numazuensis TaxID=221992 RepID=A0ABM8TS64_9BURK|nr:type VI secretion system Vgr family protein [Cupriavidus numazuensis]CAG2159136.1 hypothetical protein LMG26411_06466 [Cupriavidus numazuensis]